LFGNSKFSSAVGTLFRDKPRTFILIPGHPAIYCLREPQARVVIGVTDGMAVAAGCSQPSALLPSEGSAVDPVCGVSYLVIGDSPIVIRCKEISSDGIAIAPVGNPKNTSNFV
jgi:hypothetical protein